MTRTELEPVAISLPAAAGCRCHTVGEAPVHVELSREGTASCPPSEPLREDGGPSARRGLRVSSENFSKAPADLRGRHKQRTSIIPAVNGSSSFSMVSSTSLLDTDFLPTACQEFLLFFARVCRSIDGFCRLLRHGYNGTTSYVSQMILFLPFFTFVFPVTSRTTVDSVRTRFPLTL